MHPIKRHMLLLEVLIALSLVLLCLLPLLQPHIVMIQDEKDFTRDVQLDRVVNQLFADLLVQEFYNQRIGWDAIAAKREVAIPSDAVKKLGYQGSYTISHVAPKGEALNESKPFHLLEIQYRFVHVTSVVKKKPKTLKYTFQLFVQREKPVEKAAEEKKEAAPVKPPEEKKGG